MRAGRLLTTVMGGQSYPLYILIGNSLMGGEIARASSVTVTNGYIWVPGSAEMQTLVYDTTGATSNNNSFTTQTAGQNISFMQDAVAEHGRAYCITDWNAYASSTPKGNIAEGYHPYSPTDADAGEYIDDVLALYDDAKSWLDGQGINFYVAGIVFSSPIGDSVVEFDARMAGGRWICMVDKIRDHVGDQTVPAVINKAYANGQAGYDYVSTCNTSLTDAASWGNYLAVVDFDSLAYQSMDIHLDATGYDDAGSLSYSGIATARGNVGSYTRTFNDLASVFGTCGILINPDTAADVTKDGSDIISGLVNRGAGPDFTATGDQKPKWIADPFGTGVAGIHHFHDGSNHSALISADDTAYDHANDKIDMIYQFRPTVDTGGKTALFTKNLSTGNQREIRDGVNWTSTTNSMNIFVSADGTAGDFTESDGTTGAIAINTNYIKHCRSDGTTVVSRVSNDETKQASATESVFEGTAPFEIGSTQGILGFKGYTGKGIVLFNANLTETQYYTIGLNLAEELSADWI